MAKMVNHTGLPDNKKKKFGGAYSVYDEETVKFRNHIINRYEQPQNVDEIKRKYLSLYKEWMSSSHNLIGIEEFNELCYTQGTAESFLYFHLKYKDKKRLRICRGEYFFQQMMKNMYYENFAWLEDEPVQEGDVVLLSVPFSDTGDVPVFLEDLLCRCDELKIPVFLDLAYINLARDLTIDLRHECIEYIATSLSKVFPVEFHRIGLRMQRKRDEDQLYVYNEDGYGYLNFMSMKLGYEMMKRFPPDYIFEKYQEKQVRACLDMGLIPSQCVYFGIDDNNRYPDYNRGRDTNRLCFTRLWDGRAEGLEE